MSIDLMLAFRTEPTDLRDRIQEQGFVLQRTVPDDPDEAIMFVYRYFVRGLSRRGVWFTVSLRQACGPVFFGDG